MWVRFGIIIARSERLASVAGHVGFDAGAKGTLEGDIDHATEGVPECVIGADQDDGAKGGFGAEIGE